MTFPGRWPRRLLAGGLLATTLTGGAGCLGFLHPIPPPPPDATVPARAVPEPARTHVYVFFMNGADVLNAGNLTGLRDYVQALGFGKTYYGQVYHAGWFERELVRVHREDHDARFVLVGYGCGAKVLRSVAERAAASGTAVDVFVNLDTPAETVPAGGTGLPFAVRRLGAPNSAETLQLLEWELVQAAGRVPVRFPPAPPEPEHGPTPRPVVPLGPQALGNDWDSLKAATQLSRAQ